MKIYVASSWRNKFQPDVVLILRAMGHGVYDFRAPDVPGGVEGGFSWREVDENWSTWSPRQYRDGLASAQAAHGFRRDMEALKNCDLCVLVLPCGRSAHLELGFAAAKAKTIVYFPPECSEQQEPELMYRMCDHIAIDLPELIQQVRACEPGVEAMR